MLNPHGRADEIRSRVELLLRVGSVGHRGQPRRLDEVNHVRRHCHTHLVTTALQLQTDGCTGLDVAPSSMDSKDKSHRRTSACVSVSARHDVSSSAVLWKTSVSSSPEPSWR